MNISTTEAGAPGDLARCAVVSSIRGAEAKAGRADAHSTCQISGWRPVGRWQRVFKFRRGYDGEHEICLTYGNGPAALSIGEREFAFAYASTGDGGFDLTLDGMKSHIVAVIEGHELSLRTRNGRF